MPRPRRARWAMASGSSCGWVRGGRDDDGGWRRLARSRRRPAAIWQSPSPMPRLPRLPVTQSLSARARRRARQSRARARVERLPCGATTAPPRHRARAPACARPRARRQSSLSGARAAAAGGLEPLERAGDGAHGQAKDLAGRIVGEWHAAGYLGRGHVARARRVPAGLGAGGNRIPGDAILHRRRELGGEAADALDVARRRIG